MVLGKKPLRVPGREGSPQRALQHLLSTASLHGAQTANPPPPSGPTFHAHCSCLPGKPEAACSSQYPSLCMLLPSIYCSLFTLFRKHALEDIKNNIFKAVYEQISSKSLKLVHLCHLLQGKLETTCLSA